MTRLVMILSFEMDAIGDAVNEIIFIRDALFSRHGDRFRALARRIEKLTAADIDIPDPEAIDGNFIFSAPAILIDIIRDARALGIVK